jgi:hypothetical protein
VVGFDSIIPPGRVGKVTQEINLSAVHGGEFRKYITVISNAKNNEQLKLSLGGRIRSHLACTPDYVVMRKDSSGRNEGVLTIIADRKDLKISEISFASQGEKTGLAWQTALPLFVDYTIAKPDTSDKDGFYTYTVRMSINFAGDQNKVGDFLIKTNHPQKPEVKFSGMLEAAKPK